jgi:hypothetical protein
MISVKNYCLILVLASFLGQSLVTGAPQDNWYKSDSWGGVSGAENMIVSDDGLIWIAGNNKIAVHEQNGTLVKEFTQDLANCKDVEIDSQGNVYAIRYGSELGRLVKFDPSGQLIWSVQAYGGVCLGISDNDTIFVGCNHPRHHEIQVFQTDGNKTATIDQNSLGYDAMYKSTSISFLPNGNFIINSQRGVKYFKGDGTYVKNLSGSGSKEIAVSPDGLYWVVQTGDIYNPLTNTKIRTLNGIFNSYDKCAAFTPKGDLVIARNDNTVEIWTRTYRTHGTVVRNVPPQPRLTVTQRAGTNLVDMDVEIIDPDDATAKFAILGAVGGDFSQTSKWFVPTLTEGTDSKIDALLPTNQVHRLTWNTRADWSEIDGTFQFQVLCRDARRAASAVDLHFMTLPTADGNLTISRSSLEDSDFETHYKYEFVTGGVDKDSENNLVNQVASIPTGAVRYVFTNCGAIGRYGPTWADVNGSYLGTNLEGNVNMGVHQGIQLWDVPTAGRYMIEVAGAGGSGFAGNQSGRGAYCRGVFDFNGSETLKILVGQKGTGVGGSGGTFVTLLDNTPIIIAGGAAWKGTYADGNAETSGGGGAGYYQNDSGAGAGLLQEVGSPGGKSFVNGGTGGKDSTGQDPSDPIGKNLGGFGGGGGARVDSNHKGGGGGYSGGTGHNGPFGGKSFNADVNGTKASGTNIGHGKVIITKLPTGVTAGSGMQQILFKSTREVSDLGRYEMFNSLGYVEANASQLTHAREAGVPGSTVKQWDPNSQVKPINLPGKVNAWGFDTEHTSGRYWWAVKN